MYAIDWEFVSILYHKRFLLAVLLHLCFQVQYWITAELTNEIRKVYVRADSLTISSRDHVSCVSVLAALTEALNL